MTTPMRAMIALQTVSFGMVFGRVLRLTSRRIEIELDRDIKVGARLPWRMELTGRTDTVLGEILVGRCEAAGDGLYRLRAVISQISPSDRDKLRAWLGERRAGGTTRRFDSSVSSVSQVHSTLGVRSTSRETRSAREAALRRIDARRARSEGAGRSSGAASDSFGLHSELPSNLSAPGGGRRAMGRALREALEEGSQASSRRGAGRLGLEQEDAHQDRSESSVGSASSRLSAWRSRARSVGSRASESRSDLRQARGSSPRPPDDGPRPSSRTASRSDTGARRGSVQSLLSSVQRPERDLAASRPLPRPPVEGTQLELQGDRRLVVRFPSRTAYLAEYRRNLGSCGLQVPGDLLPEEVEKIEVFVELPSGRRQRCLGEVVVRLPTTVGLQLHLDRSQRRLMAEEAS